DAMALRPGGQAGDGMNLSHLLVGSEGTLAYSHAIELKLWPLPAKKIMGICHFPTFYKAMDAAQHLVALDPVAVELIDDTMLELARSIPLFKPIVEEAVKGEPAALLVVEFAEEDEAENLRRLARLHEMMSDLGFGWDKGQEWTGGVIDAIDPSLQARVAEMRKSGLNIMMSMKQAAKPVSFVEDCAVELKHLADYTAGLTEIFEKYGTRGTWYAHASVGCLHVRPVLDMKLGADVKKMRAIAEDAFALVRQYGGSHSGEHGDGIARSEFNEVMFGPKMAELFRRVKTLFDPHGLFNPGKIVDAPNMDARELFRFAPGYSVDEFPTQLDWSAWPGAAGGLQGAVEMCNNNGACRKLEGGVMCPSFRVTGDEKDSTRGRANTLRLALSGQLGPEAMASDEMADTMKL
ncbi:MAG: FAD-linked oxidase C-terminal domain-containing protein, partial [Pseudomonadota bacterium]|nr:FAD-linked oxidase C-terminal domain-containing protein [Pseudomonadota bacterium]